jgi:large subunit ribosomal protein L19e
MAAEILKVGKNRIWIDPEKTDNVETAITKKEIKRFIREKTIRKIPEKGVSRARARVIHEQKKKNQRSGHGSRSGTKAARTPSKEAWMKKIRAQRKTLRELRENHIITRNVYRRLYVLAKSGSFRSVSDLERYMETRNLRRRR